MKSKLFTALFIFSILFSAQFAYAGGGGGGGGKSGGSVVNSLIQGANNVTNVVVGAVETGVGTAGTWVGIQGSQALATDGENRVENGFSGSGIIGGAQQIACGTDSSATYVGTPFNGWWASGGAVNEHFILRSNGNQVGEIYTTAENQHVNFSNVVYTTTGQQTAVVSAGNGNRGDGDYTCGTVTVFPAPLNQNSTTGRGRNPNTATSTDNGTNGANGVNLSPLGSIDNPIQLNAQCVAAQVGNASVNANKSMTWNLSFADNTIDINKLANLSISWTGDGINTSSAVPSLSNIYTTIGAKALTATLTGNIDMTYYSASCSATTSVKLGSTSVQEN